MLCSSLLPLAAFATLVLGRKEVSFERRAVIPDARFTVSSTTVQAAIKCPFGIQGRDGGVVFLIHGTGSTGAESWANGPYVQYLPTLGRKYDVCWVDLPNRSESDAQLSAEYVALGVKYLAPQSKSGKVTIIGHSQGAGINPQWALIFWPSIQKLVTNYIALAPDFHGTFEGVSSCNALSKCTPATWQQTATPQGLSHYGAAQNSLAAPGGGGRALVPTTSIYTVTDDIIQPETPPFGPTSFLTGAYAHAVQDLDFCGPAHVADHFTLIFDPAAFGLAFATMEQGAPVSMALFDKSFCTYLRNWTATDPNNAAPLVNGLSNDLNHPQVIVAQEPELQPYVCQRGFATKCAAVSGFFAPV